MDFPNRAEFRAGGIQKELRRRHNAETVSQTWPRAGTDPNLASAEHIASIEEGESSHGRTE
jgi:hypothetical protein